MNYHLEIESFGCLFDLTVDFSTGLNVITGEHGAGKSTVLRSILKTIGDCAFGSKHKQMGKIGFHAVTLQNHVFDVKQGYNDHDGRYFTGYVGDQQLQGDSAENHAKFLRYFDVDSAKAWETLKERVLFYDETKTLWDKDDKGIVAALTKILGKDNQRIQFASEKIKKQTADLKGRIDQLKNESRISSGLSFVSTAEYEEKIRLLRTQTLGTLRPFELPYERERLKTTERDLAALESAFVFFCANNKKQADTLQIRLTSVQFDERQVKEERDVLIARLSGIQKLIRQTQKQIAEPLDCPACHVDLLFQSDSLVLADTAAIEAAKNTLHRLQSQETGLAIQKSTCDDLLGQVEVRKSIERLQADQIEKEAAYEIKKVELMQKIAQHKDLIQKSDAVVSTWQEIEKLERTVADIKHSNGRYDRFLEIESELSSLEPEFAQHSFMASPNGFRLFLNKEFVQQSGQYSSIINDMLGALSLGRIEFEPIFEEDGSILRVKVFHYDPKRDDWQELDERESSLNVILSFAAFLAQRKLNPQKIDELELILLDDPPHLSDPKRVAPFLDYINQLPLVSVLAWSYDTSGLVKPTRIIKLGE